mmetsp:Transcript_27127/g.65963  ORF Transcript_27127/g.65963 Transcript_27127/m.65963 type:complete len:849 (-) Transcript_27127:198-2744(-)
MAPNTGGMDRRPTRAGRKRAERKEEAAAPAPRQLLLVLPLTPGEETGTRSAGKKRGGRGRGRGRRRKGVGGCDEARNGNNGATPSTPSRSKVIRCGFCRLDNPGCGPLLHDEEDGGRSYFHECCAIYSPMVYTKDGQLVKVRSEIRRGRSLRCTVCRQTGASIGCCVKTCKKTFHFPCAGKAGCYVSAFALRCGEHSKALLLERFQKLEKSSADFQPHIMAADDIMKRKDAEAKDARGIDKIMDEKKQASAGRQANNKSRKSRLLKRLECDSGWTQFNIKRMTVNRRGRILVRQSASASKEDDVAPTEKENRKRASSEMNGATVSSSKKRSRTSAKTKKKCFYYPKGKNLRSGLPQLKVGTFVDVTRRSIPGAFTEGGRARVAKANDDGTYNLKMIVGGGIDKNVPRIFITEVAGKKNSSENTDTKSSQRSRREHRRDPNYQNGDKVIVRWTRYYVGHIMDKLTKGRYKVRFVDGTSSMEVHYSKIDPFSDVRLTEIREREPFAVIISEPPKKCKALASSKKKKQQSKMPDDSVLLKNLGTGDKIQAKDPEGQWLPVEIIGSKDDSVMVHYIGYGAKYDEWIPRDSSRLRVDKTQMSFCVLRCQDELPQWQIEGLSAIENIFKWQLPEMPAEYITKLVYDKEHRTMCLLKEGNGVKKVIGGITYKPFYAHGFAEIVFCAVIGHEQVSGCGSMLMSHVKEHLGKDGITHFITYADNGAIGFFQKQGFRKRITMMKKYNGLIVEYTGGQFMECKLDPSGVTRLYHGVGDDQNVSDGVYSKGARVQVQFLDDKTDSGRKWIPAKILESVVTDAGERKYKVHYMGWNKKWDQWTVPEHVRPDLDYNASRLAK